MKRSSGVAGTVAVGLSVVVVALSAEAQVTGFRSTVVDNAAGGPPLAGFVTNDITADFSGQLTGFQAVLQLDTGSVRIDPFLDPLAPPPGTVLPFLPTVEFGSFLTLGGPTLETSVVEPSVPGGAVNLGADRFVQFDADGINAAWNPPGAVPIFGQSDFLAARITLSDDAEGTFRFLGATVSTLTPFDAVPVSNGVIFPEPGLLAAFALLGPSTLCRRPRH